jgi:hypothetical protein
MAQAPSAAPKPAAPTPPPPGTVAAQPNVIPDAVRAKVSRADQLIAEEQARLRGDPTAPPPPQSPIKHDMRPTTDLTKGSADPTQTPPAPPPAPSADGTEPPPAPAQGQDLNPDPPATSAPVGSDEAKWEHAYKSLKGRYDGQFPKLHNQIDAMSSEIRRLVNENTNLQRAVRPAQPMPTGGPQPNGAAPNGPVGLTDEEVESFGPELVDVIRRAARAEAQALVAQGIGGVTQRVDQMGADADAQKLQAMIDFMVGQIPNFVALNSSPDLLAWLALPDPISGANRQQLLTHAWERREPSRVLAIFNSYLAQSDASQRPAGSQPPAAQAAAPVPQVQPPSARIPLVSLAAPGRAATSAPTIGGPAEQQPTYTRAQIAQFYREANMPNGPYRGRQADKDAIEADIFRAQLEGRVSD